MTSVNTTKTQQRLNATRRSFDALSQVTELCLLTFCSFYANEKVDEEEEEEEEEEEREEEEEGEGRKMRSGTSLKVKRRKDRSGSRWRLNVESRSGM